MKNSYQKATQAAEKERKARLYYILRQIKDGVTYEQIAHELGITRQRVGAIVKKARAA